MGNVWEMGMGGQEVWNEGVWTVEITQEWLVKPELPVRGTCRRSQPLGRKSSGFQSKGLGPSLVHTPVSEI